MNGKCIPSFTLSISKIGKPKSMAQINFFLHEVSFTLQQKNKLRDFLITTVNAEGKKLTQLNFIFCSDEYLLEINKQYLQHDYYTDIITFELSTNTEKEIGGEIYISIDRVKENAGTYKTSFKTELHRIMFHGLLHLLGLKDKLNTEKLAMTKEEDRLLKLYFS